MNVSSSVFAVLKIGTTICGITFFSSLSLFKWKLLTIRITVACGVCYRMIFYRMQKSEFLCNASRTIAAKKKSQRTIEHASGASTLQSMVPDAWSITCISIG